VEPVITEFYEIFNEYCPKGTESLTVQKKTGINMLLVISVLYFSCEGRLYFNSSEMEFEIQQRFNAYKAKVGLSVPSLTSSSGSHEQTVNRESAYVLVVSFAMNFPLTSKNLTRQVCVHSQQTFERTWRCWKEKDESCGPQRTRFTIYILTYFSFHFFA
jgi:hypothetical protein